MTPTEPLAAGSIDTAMRGAHGRRRIDPDDQPTPAEMPADEATGPVAFADLPSDELEALIHDPTSRREVLADPGVRRRLALADPDFAAEMKRWEGLIAAAEERAAAALEAAAGPRPRPLPGGGAAPSYDTGVSPDRVIRAAARRARGEGTGDRNAAALVDGDGTGAASFRVGR